MDSVGVGIVEMCITGYLMELWKTLFAGCGAAHPFYRLEAFGRWPYNKGGKCKISWNGG